MLKDFRRLGRYASCAFFQLVFVFVQSLFDCLPSVFELEGALRIHGDLSIALYETGERFMVQLQKAADLQADALDAHAVVRSHHSQLD